ncbi:NAD-dependent epimerase/dehydratase family protein [Siphonobacter sp. SORGH_AS_0500]|uniref:NAD-dependent epimerase/dehydratase family protein n=1 Tax=Siphonobacter sp. SORGH_AS_0500 TaxID=1864824 RepID=UPI00285CC9BE|nr:NAD-dependent epimerase/dehydratase family protein [Siphonobacter sp. SORGH_AS_0500]MDR6195787.1 dihydroflavonol-4-reductase [Siphonobacter sp. SORGH_AS_0500]
MVFLTGANGLIGSAVARKFILEGVPVRALRRASSDLRLVKDLEDLIEWIEGDVLDVAILESAIRGCTYVVHTAAVVSFSPKEREKLYKINVEGTANVVNICLSEGVQKLAYISSVAALGRPSQQSKNPEVPTVVDENQKWEESPLNSHYAISKYQAELEVWRGVSEGLNSVIVNPSVVIGEGDWDKSSTALFKYVHDEKPFYTDGTFNYVDVQDVAEAIYQLLYSTIKNERFILNAGRTTYRQFFELIAKEMGKKAPSYRVTPLIAEVAWRWEAFKSIFTKKPPLVTKETAQSSQTHFTYPGTKLVSALPFKYRTLEESTQRIVAYLTNAYYNS